MKAILKRGRLRLLGLLGFSGEHVPFISADIRTTWDEKIGFLSVMSRSRKRSFPVLIELQHAQDHFDDTLPRLLNRSLSKQANLPKVAALRLAKSKRKVTIVTTNDSSQFHWRSLPQRPCRQEAREALDAVGCEHLQPSALARDAMARRLRRGRARGHSVSADRQPLRQLPVFIGGILNSLLVAAAITARSPTPLFVAWLAVEIAICLTRLAVLIIARRRALKHQPTPTDVNLLLSIAWSGSVGYGALISLATGDWVAATLACVSAGAMVGGICFRNFSAPRLCGVMIVLSLGPTIPGALIAAQPLLLVLFAQIPVYLGAMTMACFKLSRMLIATMRAERENDRRARHDELTGLANRAGLVRALDERLSRSGCDGEALALLYLDLDDFKAVNDTHGHAAGDRLLESVAERMRGLLREGDLPARLGGDEFVVLAAGCTADRATEFGQRLIDAIGAPYDVGSGTSARVGVSVGIAMAPEHGSRAADLLRAADAALYQAKFDGGSRCRAASGDDLARLRDLVSRHAPDPALQSAAA